MSNELSKITESKELKRFTDLDELRTWLCLDFRNFVQYANGNERLKTSKLQLYLADKLQEGHEILTFLIFRNSTKTWMADLWVCWKLLCCPSFTFCIVSAKEDAGKKHMNNFKKLFSSLPALSHLVMEKQNEKSFRIYGTTSQEDTLKIESINSASLTGTHVDIMILDDVAILNTEATERKRKDLRYKLSSNVYPVVNRNNKYYSYFKDNNVPKNHKTQILYLGTPWVEESILLFDPTKEIEEEQEGSDEVGHPLMDAHRVIIPAINEKGESNFPEKYSRVQLEMQKRGMSLPSWNLQMMMDPGLLDQESRVINIDNIIEEIVELKEPIMTVDPAGQDGKGDEHAITIAGSYVNNNGKNKINIRVVKGWNVKANNFIEEALQLAQEHGVDKIYVEAKFNSYRTLFENAIEKYGNFAAIEDYNPVGNKQRRLIEVLDPNINNGTVTFHPDVLKDKLTMKQFKNWTYKDLPEYDDRLDSMAIAIAKLLDDIKHSNEWTLDVSQFQF